MRTNHVAALLLSMFLASSATASERPNIVLIMSDDMGYSDIGCFGGEIETPNLDRLASDGLRFTQFYNHARCCPTRAALLTGLYPHRAGIGHMNQDLGTRGYRGFINFDSVTIAEVLREAGYRTYLSGKWHVGDNRPHWPIDRGFDRSYALIGGVSNFFDMPMVRDSTTIKSPKEWYITDAISDATAEFIEEHDAEKPFFAYVAYTAAHWPLHAPEEDIAKYRGKYRKGWESLRKERYERMLEMGLIDPKWKLSPQDSGARDWDSLSAEEQDDRDLRMAVYAAQVDRMDVGIGRIVEALKAKNCFENTLVLFLQDNGACAEVIDRGKPGSKIGDRDSYTSYRPGWANASNTPFRSFKHWTHEGGIATPLIVHWPKGIKPRGGGKANFVSRPGHIVDLMATCVEVGEAEYPKEFEGNEIQPMDGESLTPLFRGENPDRRKPIIVEHEGNRAVRDGKWKIVAKHNQPWELYDIGADRSELNDLAKSEPDKLKELVAKYDAWASSAPVEPWGDVEKRLFAKLKPAQKPAAKKENTGAEPGK